ncbi:hypothetical protein IWW50_000100 [Coemansia erecta]|nr:hypothetical protein GGF43_001337 [Coemansia sp. RSA 2618]KAJ2830698.1 hypothetical protein IWW50_000100 [Coemansia erecta]
MSHDGLEVVRKLVDVVARTFYKDEFVIALDYLNRNEIARADVLSKFLHMKIKDVYKIYNELEKHRLVKVMARMDEPTEGTMYRRGKQRYYYLDYKQFVDVVKWRMYKLQVQVRSGMDKEQQNLGYDCKRCSRRFTILEAVSLRDMATDQFLCDYCGDELVDHTSLELAHESQKEHSRIMDQFQTIVDLLSQTDSITLPAPMQLSQVPVPDIDNMDASDGKARAGAGKELGVARDTGAARGDTIIEFAPDLTPKEAARIRESELEKKLRQNALPAWHIWSSVSGVQMVADQKITPEAALKHRRYVERRNYQMNRWNKRERERAKAAVKELEEQMRAGAGKTSTREARDDEVEAIREAFYAKFYTDVAQRSGLALPRDPRDNYRKLLDQLAKIEEIERAEMEKRRQEQERIEKERKEAAAAAAANAYDRNAAQKFRSRYNPSFGRYARGSNRRRMTHRLFEFVGAELADTTRSNSAKGDAAKVDSAQGTTEAGDDGDVPMGNEDDANEADGPVDDDVSDKKIDGDVQDTANQPNGAPADEPDPYLEGIYALSQSKRRKLGLDDTDVEDMAEPGLDTAAVVPDSLSNIKISVGGHSKAITLVTSEDESSMTTEEYIAYWNSWHQKQAV